MSEERFRLRAAVYVFLEKDGKFFFMRRKNTGWMDGKYGLPAGHLESGETIHAAAIREAKEEAGVDIDEKDLEFVHVSHRISDHDYIDFCFLVTKWIGEPYIAEQDKAGEMQWFSKTDLPDSVIPHVREVIDMYNKKISFSEVKEVNLK